MTALVERLGAAGLALLSGLLLIWQREAVMAAHNAEAISLDAMYGAVLDWSAIQTGFLFGIFGYVAGKSDGFVGALKDTGEMRQFSGYMRSAMLLGFTVTFASIPMMVFQFDIAEGLVSYAAFVCWVVISVWAFFAFARVAYIFGIIIRTKDQTKVPG